jgi:hypothetical protein
MNNIILQNANQQILKLTSNNMTRIEQKLELLPKDSQYKHSRPTNRLQKKEYSDGATAKESKLQNHSIRNDGSHRQRSQQQIPGR